MTSTDYVSGMDVSVFFLYMKFWAVHTIVCSLYLWIWIYKVVGVMALLLMHKF